MSEIAAIRADFIRRLFAVAVSVGFATTLVQMKWVKNGTLPQMQEFEQLAILLTGLIATVLSWDGYLASINAKPLNGRARYIIDISLVFIYMFFLISSSKFNLWLPILALMFVLYCVWDFLTVREHVEKYDSSLKAVGVGNEYRAPFTDVLKVYLRGVSDSPSTNRGPIITFFWAIFFVALAVINLRKFQGQVFAMSAFAIAGLIFYRRDKGASSAKVLVKGYSIRFRVALVLGLLILAGLYAYAFGNSP